MLRRGRVVDVHVPEHPATTIYGILYTLLGECMSVRFWSVWGRGLQGYKAVDVEDRLYNAVFRLSYAYGRQSHVLDVLRTYTFKVYGSRAFATDLTTAVGKVGRSIESCESSFLIVAQLPYGGGARLFKGVGGGCRYDGYAIPDLARVSSLANGLEFEKVVVREYDAELYVAALDRMVLTFLYWRNLTTPPRPQFEEVKVGEEVKPG
jgi:hypothetical protein